MKGDNSEEKRQKGEGSWWYGWIGGGALLEESRDSSFPRTEAGLGEWERSTLGKRMGIIYFGLKAIRCLVSLFEIMVVTMERNYRERDEINEGIVYCVNDFKAKEQEKLKHFQSTTL